MCNYALKMNQAKQAAEMYRAGMSMTQIAHRLLVSRNAVKNVLVLLDVPIRERHEARRLRWKVPGSSVVFKLDERQAV